MQEDPYNVLPDLSLNIVCMALRSKPGLPDGSEVLPAPWALSEELGHIPG